MGSPDIDRKLQEVLAASLGMDVDDPQLIELVEFAKDAGNKIRRNRERREAAGIDAGVNVRVKETTTIYANDPHAVQSTYAGQEGVIVDDASCEPYDCQVEFPENGKAFFMYEELEAVDVQA